MLLFSGELREGAMSKNQAKNANIVYMIVKKRARIISCPPFSLKLVRRA
jgi:hypothetical protein